MPIWKQILLGLYYHGTYASRAWHNARRCALGQAPVMVLFYHRIADENGNPWTASNRTFERHIDWLKRSCDLISLSEAQQRLQSGTNRRPAVSITFDDGYADNCARALPLLIREGIPCTYFVSSRHILEGQPFPHDIVRGIPLAPNTPAQIRALAAAGIEIGSHTRTHADLGQAADWDELYDEIVVSREELQELTGRPIRYLALPYGQIANLSVEAFRLARCAGYDGVCSAHGGFNFPGDDPFHLKRIHADNDMIRLKNWVTVDPRKLRAAQTVRYPDFARQNGTVSVRETALQSLAETAR